MEAIQLLRKAIDYVEEHLHKNIELDDIAQAAMSSKYHFQRMFYALTGFTVTQYVRNRRLTLAAEELAVTDGKVIEIALKYGYESPEAFTKAFQRVHGVTPLMAKKKNVKLKAFPRISFHIQIKGEKEMNYRIEEEQPLVVVGKDFLVKEDPFKEIPIFVEEMWNSGEDNRINEAVGRLPGSLLNGYHFDYREDGSRRYLMGFELSEGKEVPNGMVTLNVPSQVYAVFESSEAIPDDVDMGLEVLNVWQRIYSEWFPSSNFEQVEGVCMEKYFWVDEEQSEYSCEVWIPVRRKA